MVLNDSQNTHIIYITHMIHITHILKLIFKPYKKIIYNFFSTYKNKIKHIIHKII